MWDGAEKDEQDEETSATECIWKFNEYEIPLEKETKQN